MFAGKSTRLLHELAQHAGPTLLIKPARDTRYSTDAVVTHDGVQQSAHAISFPIELHSLADQHPCALIGIDEAHFFGAPLIPAVRALLERKRIIFIAGVERDHGGLPFEPFPTLLCEADDIIKLTARCTACNGAHGPAIHSQRMTPSNALILIGGADLYQPRCRHCFTGDVIYNQTTRTSLSSPSTPPLA